MKYIILPKGTFVLEGLYKGARSFEAEEPLLAAPNPVWDLCFMAPVFVNRSGQTVQTGLKWNYVSGQPKDFAGGQTVEEAWRAF